MGTAWAGEQDEAGVGEREGSGVGVEVEVEEALWVALVLHAFPEVDYQPLAQARLCKGGARWLGWFSHVDSLFFPVYTALVSLGQLGELC